MSRVMVRRRPDGIVQIRPRPLWRALAGQVQAALLAMLIGCGLFLALLAAALVRSPAIVLLVAGCVTLGLAAARWGLIEPRAVEVRARPQPDDAA